MILRWSLNILSRIDHLHISTLLNPLNPITIASPVHLWCEWVSKKVNCAKCAGNELQKISAGEKNASHGVLMGVACFRKGSCLPEIQAMSQDNRKGSLVKAFFSYFRIFHFGEIVVKCPCWGIGGGPDDIWVFHSVHQLSVVFVGRGVSGFVKCKMWHLRICHGFKQCSGTFKCVDMVFQQNPMETWALKKTSQLNKQFFDEPLTQGM